MIVRVFYSERAEVQILGCCQVGHIRTVERFTSKSEIKPMINGNCTSQVGVDAVPRSQYDFCFRIFLINVFHSETGPVTNPVIHYTANLRFQRAHSFPPMVRVCDYRIKPKRRGITGEEKKLQRQK